MWHLDCKLGAWSPAVCTCNVSGAAMGSAFAPCMSGPNIAALYEVQADKMLTRLHWRCIRQFVGVVPSRDTRRTTAQHACESVTVYSELFRAARSVLGPLLLRRRLYGGGRRALATVLSHLCRSGCFWPSGAKVALQVVGSSCQVGRWRASGAATEAADAPGKVDWRQLNPLCWTVVRSRLERDVQATLGTAARQ